MTLSKIKQRFVKCLSVALVSVFLFSANHLMAASSITVCIEKDICFSADHISFSLQMPEGGTSSGRPIFSDLSVLKPIDSYSARLFVWAAQGRLMHDATISINLDKTQSTIIFLENILVSNIEIKASAEDEKTFGEKISLDYSKITITTATDSSCWDVKNNNIC